MYGNLPPRQLPVQDAGLVLLLADRFARARAPHDKWAETARQCVDFMEGRQWDAQTLRDFAKMKRPALTLNKLARQVRLVLGYFENNPNTIKYLPGHDGSGSEETAETLNRLSKQIDELNEMQFIQAEQMLDGLVTGRGYIDTRLGFEDNDFGEERDTVRDPFWVMLDPEGDAYDLNRSSYLIEKRVASLDEIEFHYGSTAMTALSGFVREGGTSMNTLVDLYSTTDFSPPKGFGQIDNMDRWMQEVAWLYGDLIDPFRKDVTLLDFQYWVRSMARLFIDLETGDRSVIPDDWTPDQIAKVLYYAEEKGESLKVVVRPIKKVRWTTLAGPIIVYDREVPYDSFSLTPYFPYFRRGITRGMVEDLIDSQSEVNKRRSARIEILSKTANGGWLIHKDGMDPTQVIKVREYGSTPGVTLEWKGQPHMKPEQIAPQVGLQRVAQLEADADRDFGEISGINESALGDIDKVQSGRAIEARQRQAVVSVQMYMTNRNRTVQLLGKKRLEIIQKHYTERRIVRTIGDDGRASVITINDRGAEGARAIVNDVTVGKYMVATDETPISATFLNAQFEEALMLIEKMGPVGAKLLEVRPDLLVDMSSLPRKEEWKQGLQQAMAQVSAATGVAPGGPSVPVQPGAPSATAPALDQSVQGPGAQIIPLSPTGMPAA